MRVIETTNEPGLKTREYFDTEGRPLARKVQDRKDDQNRYLTTVYVYDDLGHQRAVIQPEGLACRPTTCWTPTSSKSGAIAPTTMPTAGPSACRGRAEPVYLVYNAHYQPILRQDGNGRVSRCKFVEFQSFFTQDYISKLPGLLLRVACVPGFNPSSPRITFRSSLPPRPHLRYHRVSILLYPGLRFEGAAIGGYQRDHSVSILLHPGLCFEELFSGEHLLTQGIVSVLLHSGLHLEVTSKSTALLRKTCFNPTSLRITFQSLIPRMQGFTSHRLFQSFFT